MLDPPLLEHPSDFFGADNSVSAAGIAISRPWPALRAANDTGILQAAADRSELRSRSGDDWTDADPTRILFVVLTVVAIPWFIARIRRRLAGRRLRSSPVRH
jgi:hypothetical protein